MRGENIWVEKIDGAQVRFERMLSVNGKERYYARPVDPVREQLGKYKVADDLDTLKLSIATAISRGEW